MSAGDAVEVPWIETERLVLREFLEVDRAPYAALNADPEVMAHFPSTLTRAQSDEMVDRIMARWAEQGHGLWAVEVQATGEFAGFVGLVRPTFETHFTPCVEVGWRLARWAWGRGYAPEAAEAVIAWGFANLDLPRDEIVSFTTTLNLKSQRVMQKLGMTHDPADDFDHPLLPDWSERRHVLYRLQRPGRSVAR